MDGEKSIDGFHLDDDPIIDDDVELVGAVEEHAFVADGHGPVPLEPKAAQCQLATQAVLIRGLEEARTEQSMHFDPCTDDLVRPIIKSLPGLPGFL